jgi:regulatory protein
VNRPKRNRPDPVPGPVTATSVQARDPNRMSVFVDEEFSFGMPLDAALDLGIRTGVELDEALLAKCLAAEAAFRARQKALNLLAHRPRSVGELTRRLGMAGFSGEAIAFAMGRMEALGYLNDEAFAESFVRDRMIMRGLGRRRVLMELTKNGIGRELAEQVVARISLSRDEVADAYNLAVKKHRTLARVTDPRKRRERLYSHLVRKGFETDIIRDALARLQAEVGTED